MTIIRAIIFLITRNLFTHLDTIMAWVKPLKKTIPQPNTMLINRWDRIGDAVLTLPLVHAIKTKFPSITIDMLCSTGNAWVFENNPHINRVIELPGVGFTYGLKRIVRFLFAPFNARIKNQLKAAIGNRHYDVCLDCVSGEFSWLLKPFATTLIGPKTEDGFSWIYDAYPSAPIRYAKKPLAQYYMDALNERMGNPSAIIEHIANVPINHSTNVDTVLSKVTGEFILVSLAGSGIDRALPIHTWQSLLQSLSESFQVVVFDDHSQQTIQSIGSKMPENIMVVQPLTLPELAAISRKARVLIGVEGGAAHYCATQCNTLMIFGAKFYRHHYNAWLPNGGAFKQISTTKNEVLLSNGSGAAVLIERPKKQVPFKPYYIAKEPLSLSADIILTKLNETHLNKWYDK